MGTELDRKIIRSRQVQGLLDTSRTGLLKLRSLSDFPAPLPMPGHPRWYLDEILAWRSRRTRAEVAAAAVLADAPRLAACLPADQHRECVTELENMSAFAALGGRQKVAELYRALANDLRAAGPDVMGAARELAR